MSRQHTRTQVSLPSIHEVFPEHFSSRAATSHHGHVHQALEAREINGNTTGQISTSGHRTHVPKVDMNHSTLVRPLNPEAHHYDSLHGSEDTRKCRHYARTQYSMQPTPANSNPAGVGNPSLSSAGLSTAFPSKSPPTPTQAYSRNRRGYDNDKRHVCGLCGKGFNRPSSLSTHMNSHTGEKPFQCPKCGQLFSVNSNMRRHFRTHGPDAISPILPPFGSLVVGDHASPFPPFSSPPSTYSGRSDYRPHVYGSDMSYGSDSDCEDGSDQGALSDGDTRQDILEKTNVSFSRIKLGSYSSYSDSRAAPRGH